MPRPRSTSVSEDTRAIPSTVSELATICCPVAAAVSDGTSQYTDTPATAIALLIRTRPIRRQGSPSARPTIRAIGGTASS